MREGSWRDRITDVLAPSTRDILRWGVAHACFPQRLVAPRSSCLACHRRPVFRARVMSATCDQARPTEPDRRRGRTTDEARRAPAVWQARTSLRRLPLDWGTQKPDWRDLRSLAIATDNSLECATHLDNGAGGRSLACLPASQ
jgi:hypothetical protein